MSRLKQLGKDSLVYGIGGIFAKGLSFFLLPVYTKLFTPEEYGTIEMLTVICSFLGAILTIGLDSAQSFYFYKEKKSGEKSQKKVISAILQLRILWGLFVVILATVLSPLLNALLFQGKLSLIYFGISFVSVLISQLIGQGAELYRLLYKPWRYVFITAAEGVVSALLILLFTVGAGLGLFGYFLGVFVASIVVAILTWYLVRKYLLFDKIYTEMWPKVIRFGAPLLPAGLGLYFMSASDRWFIQYYLGPYDLGIYAVGAKYAMLLAMAVEVFRKAWWPIALDAMHSDDGAETFRNIGIIYISIALSGLVILTTIAPWMVKIMTPPEFWSAYNLIGILSWQSILYGFFMLASAGIWKNEMTHINAITMIACAVINIMLNYLLVPTLKVTGSAIATIISYFVWIIVTLIISNSMWKICFPYTKFCIQIVCAILFCFVNHEFDLEMTASILLSIATLILIVILTVDSSSWRRLSFVIYR